MASEVKEKSSQGEIKSRRKQDTYSGRKQREHWWTGSILPLEWGGNKIRKKMDAENYIDPSVWVNVQVLNLLSAPLLFQPLLTHVLPAKTCIQQPGHCGCNTINWNTTANTPNLPNRFKEGCGTQKFKATNWLICTSISNLYLQWEHETNLNKMESKFWEPSKVVVWSWAVGEAVYFLNSEKLDLIF